MCVFVFILSCLFPIYYVGCVCACACVCEVDCLDAGGPWHVVWSAALRVGCGCRGWWDKVLVGWSTSVSGWCFVRIVGRRGAIAVVSFVLLLLFALKRFGGESFGAVQEGVAVCRVTPDPRMPQGLFGRVAAAGINLQQP